MPEWSQSVPEYREYATIQLLRVPVARKIQAIAINSTLLGCNTHWDGRGTGPCTGADCPQCRDGHVGRWHAYVPMYSQLSGHIAVVQLTQLAAAALQEEATRWGTLRGLLVQLSRVKPRENARILVEARKLPVEPPDLPQPLDVARFMDSLWNGQSTSRDSRGEPRREPHP